MFLQRSSVRLFVVVLGLLSITAISWAQKVIVKDNVFIYNNKRYFTTSAEDVQIGSIGEKKTPLTQANYLEVQDNIPVNKLKIQQKGIVYIDFKQSSETAIKAKLGPAVGYMGLDVNTAWKKIQTGELVLVKFIVENEDMADATNDSPDRLSKLDKYGNDARICHQIFVVLEATTATKVVSSTKINASGTANGVKLTVETSNKNERETTVTLSSGMTFAYLLAKIDWDKKAKNLKIDKLTDDQQSIY